METWMDKDKTFDIPGFKHIESKECDRHYDGDDQQPSSSRGTGKRKRSGLYGGTAVFNNKKRVGLMSLDQFHDDRYPSILHSIVYRMFISAKAY
jgi:hypothetical protein